MNFYIVGTLGEGLQKTKNIKFLGWISKEEMIELRNKSAICLRLPQHDGYSLTVIEALSYGHEVIWTIPHEQCYFIRNVEHAELIFKDVVNNIKNRNLLRNKNNIQFAKSNFSQKIIMSNFIKKIEEVTNYKNYK